MKEFAPKPPTQAGLNDPIIGPTHENRLEGVLTGLIGIDVFCGAGGMSLGFELAGFTVAGAVDVDPINVETHTLNFPDCATVLVDVCTLSGAELRRRAGLKDTEIDVLFGGPPCQGFSSGGKHRDDDERNGLVGEFARLVDEIQPRYFVMENVSGLLSPKHAPIVDAFAARISRAGYSMIEPILTLDAADYGVPQRRRRTFVLGTRMGQPAPNYPTHRRTASVVRDQVSHRPTVWDALGDLAIIDQHEKFVIDGRYMGRLGEPSAYALALDHDAGMRMRGSRLEMPSAGLSACNATAHSPATVKRFNATVPGSREAISRFWRLERNGLAPTLRAGTGPDHGSYTAPRPIHPIFPRCIRVREAARLHSYPDWFAFHNTKWHGFRQVGNSVPPRLAEAVASRIRQALATSPQH